MLLFSVLAAKTDVTPRRELDLTWQAAPGCPSEAWAREEFERVLGKEARARVVAKVKLSKTEAGHSLLVETELAESKGERRLDEASCEELAEAAVALLALAAEGNLDGFSSPSPDESVSSPASKKVERRTNEPKEEGEGDKTPSAGSDGQPTRDAAKKFGLDAGGLVDSAVFPNAAFGLGLRGTYYFAEWTAAVDAQYLFPIEVPLRTTVDLEGPIEGIFDETAISLRFCHRTLVTGGPSVHLCLGGGVSLLAASARGVSDAKSVTTVSPTFDFGIDFLQPLVGPLSFRLSPGGRLLFERENYAIDGLGNFFSPSFVAFRAAAALEVRF